VAGGLRRRRGDNAEADVELLRSEGAKNSSFSLYLLRADDWEHPCVGVG